MVAKSAPLLKLPETTVGPSLIRPFAFTENCVARAPSYQKSNPMFVTAEAVSSTLGPTS